jgi:hypothetical protein
VIQVEDSVAESFRHGPGALPGSVGATERHLLFPALSVTTWLVPATVR